MTRPSYPLRILCAWLRAADDGKHCLCFFGEKGILSPFPLSGPCGGHLSRRERQGGFQLDPCPRPLSCLPLWGRCRPQTTERAFPQATDMYRGRPVCGPYNLCGFCGTILRHAFGVPPPFAKGGWGPRPCRPQATEDFPSPAPPAGATSPQYSTSI